jgi:hypothetical protein
VYFVQDLFNGTIAYNDKRKLSVSLCVFVRRFADRSDYVEIMQN